MPIHLDPYAYCQCAGTLSVPQVYLLKSCPAVWSDMCVTVLCLFAVARGSGQCSSASKDRGELLFPMPVLWGHAA